LTNHNPNREALQVQKLGNSSVNFIHQSNLNGEALQVQKLVKALFG